MCMCFWMMHVKSGTDVGGAPCKDGEGVVALEAIYVRGEPAVN